MALKPCRECKRQVSSEAPTCPHCGVPTPVADPVGKGEAATVSSEGEPTTDPKPVGRPANLGDHIADAYSDSYEWARKFLRRGRLPDVVVDDLLRRFTLGPKQASLVVHVAMDSLSSDPVSRNTEHSDRVPDRPTWQEFEAERRALEGQPGSDEESDAPAAIWPAIWLAGLVFLFVVHLMMPPINPVRDSTDQWIDVIGGMLGNFLVFALVFVWFKRTRPWIIVGACALGLLQLTLLT